MPTLQLLRVTALLAVLTLAWQFVSAGLLMTGAASEDVHGGGAIVLHVTTGLAALAAVLHQRASRGPLWVPVLAVVVFGLTFAQAYAGSHLSLAVHVPGALVVTVGPVWLLAWSYSRAAGSRRSTARV